MRGANEVLWAQLAHVLFPPTPISLLNCMCWRKDCAHEDAASYGDVLSLFISMSGKTVKDPVEDVYNYILWS